MNEVEIFKLIQEENEKTRAIFSETIQPIRDMVMKHNQTLYGENGTNGMRRDVKNLKAFMYKVVYGIGGLVTVASVLKFFKVI